MSAENPTTPKPQFNTVLLSAAAAVGLFAGGVLLGSFLDRPSHPPRPMVPPQAEMRPGGPQRFMGPGVRPGLSEERREQARERHEEIQKWAKPIGDIREKYRAEIAKILRPEQKAKMDQAVEAREEVQKGPGRRGHDGGPAELMGMVLITPQLERIAGNLVLDAAQKKQVEALLKKQREELLAWVDSNPPPKPEPRPRRMAAMEEPELESIPMEGLAAFLPHEPGHPHHP